MRRLAIALCALIALGIGVPAFAFTALTHTPVTYPYVAAFSPTFRNAFPYSGTMELTFNNGIIRGTYRDMSIKPGGPFSRGGIIPVTGGTTGKNIHLTIGPGFSISNGQIDGNGTINGTGSWQGRFYNFLAEVGKPGAGR